MYDLKKTRNVFTMSMICLPCW